MKREFQMPNICSLCWKDSESIQHLFYQCDYSTQVRSLYVTSLTILTSKEHAKSHKQPEITIIFIMWRERFRRIFYLQIKTSLSLKHHEKYSKKKKKDYYGHYQYRGISGMHKAIHTVM
jgi:hypothetical protein